MCPVTQRDCFGHVALGSGYVARSPHPRRLAAPPSCLEGGLGGGPKETGDGPLSSLSTLPVASLIISFLPNPLALKQNTNRNLVSHAC